MVPLAVRGLADDADSGTLLAAGCRAARPELRQEPVVAVVVEVLAVQSRGDLRADIDVPGRRGWSVRPRIRG